MVEKIGHVRNPLTVIAIFAGLAEVSGTVVLPFLSDTTQALYVWFLMGFPVFLVAVFFFVLYEKHHVLYAPSDFHDDRTFKELFENAPGLVKVEKLDDEAESPAEQNVIDENAPQRPAPDVNSQSQDNSAYVRSFRGTSLLAEELVVARFSKDHGVNFERNVALKGHPKLVFDAISSSESKPTVLEVRFTRAGILTTEQMDEYFDRASKFYELLPESLKGKITFVYVLVTDREGRAARIERAASLIRQRAGQYPFRTTVVSYNLKDLEQDISSTWR